MPSVLVLQADRTPRLLTPVEVELAVRAHPVLLRMTVGTAKYHWARGHCQVERGLAQ